MAEDTAVDIDQNEEESRVYEASFHIVPSGGEEGALKEFEAIRTLLESKKAAILGQDIPRPITFAYEIQKDIERKRHTFPNGYFGWFVFEADPSAAHAVKEALNTMNSVIRFLLVKTIKEAATPQKHSFAAAPTHERREAPRRKEEKPAGEMNVAQVDAEIAKLVVE